MAMIVSISFSFSRGGAAIAARKFTAICKSLTDQKIVSISQEDAGFFQYTKRVISYILSVFQIDHNPIKHSLNLFSYPPVLKYFALCKEDVFHIHWINNDTVSIFDFEKIPAGSIITLHDEWIYCGAEHVYNVMDNNLDFISGYSCLKKGLWGVHWNYIIWRVKFKTLSKRNDLIYTVPSHWMLSRAQSSMMLKHADIRLLPNPIDTNVFLPNDKKTSYLFRKELNLDETDFIFCFGVICGRSSYLKGSSILEESLDILNQLISTDLSSKIKFVIFGGKHVGTVDTCGFTSHLIGHISEPCELAKVYSASDCVVVPSLVESFGQVAAEALACETPVISFACSGLLDIVIDGHTGLTAEPYCPDDLAGKLKEMVMLTIEQRKQLGVNGREHVCKHFSYSVVAEKYKKIIDDAYQLKMKKDIS